jgi:hypothetical protein
MKKVCVDEEKDLEGSYLYNRPRMPSSNLKEHRPVAFANMNNMEDFE